VVPRYVLFAVVGATAAMTHFSVAVALVSGCNWSPQIANVGGYLVALFVSYQGQSRLTFAGSQPASRHLLKFILTSLSAFAINAMAYAALLHWTALDYRVALALVLVSVAVATYAALRFWVFLDPSTRVRA
jgi:putative flippase GtrA